MRTFLAKTGLFTFLLFLCLQGVGWTLIRTGNQGHAVENSRIYLCLEKARQVWPETEVFVFGDSVGNQMYPPERNNGRINSLALVMPSTLAGQYFLLSRLAETNVLQGKTVVLLLSPEGFAGELSHQASYHYVLKPFHNEEFQPWDDLFYQQRVPRSPLNALSQWPIIKCSNWNPPDWMPYLHEEAVLQDGPLSAFSVHYLTQMEALLEKEGAAFRILPTIRRQSRQGDDFSLLKERISEEGLETMFSGYFDHFRYFEDELFGDIAHLKNRDVLGANVLGL